VDRIVAEANARHEDNRVWALGEFVTEVYFPNYSRKWKASTRVNNMNRVSIHLVDSLGALELSSFRRDELQDVLDEKTRRAIDTPKTDQSIRKAALPEGLLREIESWRRVSLVTRDDAWVFPSERMTPMSKDNCWNRNIKPKLESVGMGWANFLVMRRTHATLMSELGVNGKLVADQLEHSLDVSQNVYTQSPVESRLPAVNQLEKRLWVM
jgi:hypothetical protein